MTVKTVTQRTTRALQDKRITAKEAKEKTPQQQTVVTADQAGDRATLKADAYIPLTMAVTCSSLRWFPAWSPSKVALYNAFVPKWSGMLIWPSIIGR